VDSKDIRAVDLGDVQLEVENVGSRASHNYLQRIIIVDVPLRAKATSSL
jgi:hypothetical protein